MIRAAARLPRRISVQIVLLILIAVVANHAIVSAIFFLAHRAEGPGAGPAESRLAAIVRMLDMAQGEAARRAILETAMQAYPDLGLAPSRSPMPDVAAPGLPRRFVHEIGRPGVRVAADDAASPGDGKRRWAIRLGDGTMFEARLKPQGFPVYAPLIVALVFFAVSVAILAVWAARALTAPLTAFAEAAASFDITADTPPLPERGPAEVRTAAAAFNAMRLRIRRLVEDRTRMLAAVGHDLRTPITRLRLRAEFLEDEAVKAQTLSDLDQMARMADTALAFLRNDATGEAMQRFDLAATLQTICDQHADAGEDVAYMGPDHLAVLGRPDDLGRALENLVQNAVVHGGCARVGLSTAGAWLRIDVEDEGPGIAEAEKAAVLKPFARGEAARTMTQASGFGLGLSIANAVIEAHGGRLLLLDRQPSGLTARVELPLPA